MQFILILAAALTAAAGHGADATPKASGTIDGKTVRFPEESASDGAKATLGLLGSCHDDENGFAADDLKKARSGEHVRFLFAKPEPVTVLGKQYKVSELVFALPLKTGVIWVRTEDNKVVRFSKYERPKEEPFTKWLKAAVPAK